MKKRLLLMVAMTLLVAVGAQARAKYIFYFIGDGMGMGHVYATQQYNRIVLGQEQPLLMMQFPVAGQCMTYSASHPITDSAAAGTALSTGIKTSNGMIGENPDSLPIYSIAVELQKRGYAIGVASTVAGNDATPAAFYGHSHSRYDNEILARQAVMSGYDFLGGPMWRGTSDNTGRMSSEWAAEFRRNGYDVFYGYDEYAGARPSNRTASRGLLLSSNPQGDQAGYTIDSIPGTLTAAQLTEAALDYMQRSDADQFFMMIEGGNIDWAAHANDGGAVIKQILNYQEAIDVAYRFYLQYPDETLIVVTADHDTGGMAFGRADNPKNGNIALIDFQKISKDRFSDWCKTYAKGDKSITWDEMKQFITDNLGLYGAIDVTAKEDEAMQQAFTQAFVTRTAADEKTLYNDFNAFAVRVFDIFNKKAGIGWTTGSHTANMVPVYAIGEGSDLFKGLNNNIEIPAKILKASK